MLQICERAVLPPGRVRGNACGASLALRLDVSSAFTALDDSDLADLKDEIHERVFARDPDDLFEIEQIGDVWEWHFKPMVELLFRHIAHVAANRTASPPRRKDDILWAVGMAGF
ncbi:MAG: hypothetical protein DMF85_09960 [Acidobacteria bacterium]|nr:MAG: hypothetical protein DMF85_09960 [Acidobacteriota bacterium]